MAANTRQNSLLVNQDWTKIYESFRNADFQSYDFQTLRKSMIDYLRIYYPEDFNDYIESSEFIALIDLVAFMGQSLAFRTDLNARENFIDTAERRDSVLKLAKLVSYIPKRNQTATGYLKFESVQTTQTLNDSNGIDLTSLIVKWNDSTNVNWYEQFITILNAALPSNQQVGRPANSKLISGVTNDEYNVNLPPGTLPRYSFATNIENAGLTFEVVSPTSANANYIYEAPPVPGSPLNILYKNDNLGNASNDTGFFFYFKQGSLASQDFGIQESLPNNVVSINFDNINNTDVWLWELSNLGTPSQQWTQVPSVNGTNIIYNNNAAKKSFQVASRANDQIDLVFGDGTFAAIPQGNYRVYYRTSTGLGYKITPDEMQNITIAIPYISKFNRVETLTVVASLKYTVANALPRESLAEIKTKAPQLYYTQNRMVTAEDYNTFPYANYSTISKVKAVNRVSSGVSRFLDVADTTGRYSSTNIFADDGIVFEEDASTSLDFTWTTSADINKVIQNRILPVIRDRSLLHFYYANYARYAFTDMYWHRSTVGSGSSTGYFVNAAGVKQQIGSGVTGNAAYMTADSLIVFSPGVGNYFNSQNEIKALPASGQLPQGGQTLLYAALTQLVGNGSQGDLSNGFGPVKLSENIPDAATAVTVIPAFSNEFSTAFTTELIGLISSYTEFGIRYDQNTKSWAIVTAQNLDLTSPFSQTNQGSTVGLNLDASWLLSFTVTGEIYTVQIRGLSYIFESFSETKFYFDNKVKIFDPTTGLTINDFIKVLRSSADIDTGLPLTTDVTWNVYNQIAESDGYVDNSKVLVTYSDSNDDGIPDNPDIFQTVVKPILYQYATLAEVTAELYNYAMGQIFYAATDAKYYQITGSAGARTLTVLGTEPHDKYVFFMKTYDYNSFVTYQPVDSALVDVDWSTELAIKTNINIYGDGQIFYATAEGKFYILSIVNGTRILAESQDYIARTGRSSMFFQYRHNAPGDRRIDPSPSNLIDMYILTKAYDTEYRSWILDTTGTVSQPDVPSGEALRLALGDLENFKTVSDAIIYNNASFKPLFGNKAKPELQATIKVIKNANINISDSEIRSQVLAFINVFFASNNWDFGETFYFTELATYIQQAMAPNVSSIIIVPNSASQTYGSLQQISANPNEILISCATVDNIEVISAITAAQLNLQNQSVNTLIN